MLVVGHAFRYHLAAGATSVAFLVETTFFRAVRFFTSRFISLVTSDFNPIGFVSSTQYFRNVFICSFFHSTTQQHIAICCLQFLHVFPYWRSGVPGSAGSRLKGLLRSYNLSRDLLQATSRLSWVRLSKNSRTWPTSHATQFPGSQYTLENINAAKFSTSSSIRRCIGSIELSFTTPSSRSPLTFMTGSVHDTSLCRRRLLTKWPFPSYFWAEAVLVTTF